MTLFIYLLILIYYRELRDYCTDITLIEPLSDSYVSANAVQTQAESICVCTSSIESAQVIANLRYVFTAFALRLHWHNPLTERILTPESAVVTKKRPDQRV
jgi:hypothetical protein